MDIRNQSGEIRNMSEDAAMAIARGDVQSEDIRWAARRRMALWSFRVLVLLTFSIIGYGFFAPDGVETVNALLGVITFIYGAFGSIIAGYFGVDWTANKKASKGKAPPVRT